MMLVDNLDDYEAGRCDDCATYRGAAECRGCEFEPAPPILGRADTERLARLDAERVTLQFGVASARHLADLSESPLFGGPKQMRLI